MLKKDQKVLFSGLTILFCSFFIIPVNAEIYSNTLANEYSWQVKTLIKEGDFATPYLEIGDQILRQDDVLKIKLLEDINEIANDSISNLWTTERDWIEFYINEKFLTNQTDEVELFDLDWVNVYRSPLDFTSYYDLFAILPVTYTNETGSFDNFEVLNSEMRNIKSEQSFENNFHGYYEKEDWKFKQIVKISKKTWTVKIKWEFKSNIDDFTETEDWSKRKIEETQICELRFNRETGFLVYLNFDYLEYEKTEEEGEITEATEKIELLLTNNELTTRAPIPWLVPIFSITCLGIFAFRRKKST